MRRFENKRLRWLIQKEAQRLIDELPPHLGGWSDYDTVLRYAHLSSDHLQLAAERVSGTFSSLVLGF